MNRRSLLSLAALLAGVAVIFVLVLWPKEAPPPAVQASRTSAPVVPAAPSPPPASSTAATQAAAPRADLTFRRLEIETSSVTPEACLVFSEPLRAEDEPRYRDYLSFAPDLQVALRVAGERLCIAGLAFGRQYTVELRAGLPAASGAKLALAETVPLELSDRPALVAFRDGLILPREGSGGVPITTVNVERLAVRLYRVPDRLVSQISRDRFAARQTYPWELRQIEQQQGALIWRGEMRVQAPRNETVTSLFPLREAVPTRRPGVYVLAAEDAASARTASTSDDDYDESYRPIALQWLIESDVGLTTFAGADGLHVFARSYQSAQPLAGIAVALVARNNDELARATTDALGHAQFAPGLLRGKGGDQATAVMAYGGEGDFTFQDLGRPAFDLSDRGVEGRALPGPVDAYLYTDRGIYRPGETVQLVTLLRDRVAKAIEATPLVLTILRPDGAEFRRVNLADAGAGAMHHPLVLSDTAPRGHWQAVARLDPAGEPVGRVEFDVEDFVPQRLKLDLTTEAALLQPGDAFRIDTVARFLYGAPAAELAGEAEARIAADPRPYPDFAGFRFGLAQESFTEQLVPLEIEPTDAEGRTAATGKLDKIAATTLPLRATMRIAIFEPGGRATEDEISLPLRTRKLALGVRPLFKGDRIQEDTEAGFEVIALDERGARIPREKLAWDLVQELTEYQWYRADRGWRYERNVRDRAVESGRIDVAAASPATLRRTLPWGYYRLTVHDDATGAATSVRFSAGWRGVLSEDRPDRVEIAADKESYAPGATARIAIRPPVPGKALLVIASDRIFTTRLVDVPAEGTTVEVPVGNDWGAGAYAVVAHYRPLTQDNGRAPVRAIGVAWLALDAAPRTLAVALGAPATTLPRQKIDVPVRIANLVAGETAFVTLAAVDEGILQLTKFKTPAPADYFFGKRRLAVDIRDDYGRLIDAKNAVLASLRQGGDSVGGRGLDVVPTKTVALFSGPVALDATGAATIALDLPDFTGDLRLMAVAYQRERVGSGDAYLILRDPVIGEATLPRFLAPGDKSQVAVNLHNVEGKPGAYTARLTAEGPVAFGDAAERTVDLAAGARQLLAFPIEATAPGIAKIALELTGPDGFAVAHDWPIQVRGAQLPLATQEIATLAPGEELRLQSTLVADYLPGTAKVSVGFASWRSFDVGGLLRSLDRYPFGCIEQTTSRAFPLLFFNDLALLGGAKQERGLEYRVQGAINRVLDMQTAEGDFGMWSAGSFPAHPWISLYALDFLAQAKAKGYAVPDEALRRGQRFLARAQAGKVDTGRYEWTRVDENVVRGRIQAYAAYLLARNGSANPAELRLMHDGRGPAGALGSAQLGAALLQIGDRARAAEEFGEAWRRVQSGAYSGDYYGSSLRDLAGVTALAAEAGQSTMLPQLVERIGRLDLKSEYLTTQEKSWLLLAANALTRNRGRIAVAIDGTELRRPGDPVNVMLDAEQIAAGVTLRNTGDREIWRTVAVEGVPRASLPAEANGVTIERHFLTLDGEEAELDGVRQNDRLIVSLEGAATDALSHEFVLLDLLPAGWQIEGVLLPDKDGKSPYDFLADLRKPRVNEARDDRFVAAFNAAGTTRRSYRPSGYDEDDESGAYRLAYVVRATTPGTYVLPAATIEDMYRPHVKARTEMGTVTVLAR